MRLFIGIDLPENIKNQIYDYLKPIHLSEKGWEKAHDYHQTLLFIGESTEEELKLIKERMETIRFRSFELRPSIFRFFNRRVMFLAFEPSDDLQALKLQINSVFPEYLRTGEKPFLPHVTVKRWQRYEYNQLDSELRKREFIPQSFTVNGLDLFLSEKDSENNKYHVIHKVSF